MIVLPPIDPRNAQDLVDEAKRRIPLYCPEWTDHNVSDPGVTLIELFAFMTDALLYRLNRVGDRDYLKFLELMGVRPRPAVPAGTELTFWYTKPQAAATTIPRGTEVATLQTETEPLITFTTDEDLIIRVPRLRYLVLAKDTMSPAGYELEDASAMLSRGDALVQVFQEPPADPDPRPAQTEADSAWQLGRGDCFYLGFSEQRGVEEVPQRLAGHAIRVALGCQQLGGSNIRAEDPPLTWEFWTGEAWADLQPEDEVGSVLARSDQELSRLGRRLDGTRGLNQPGSVVLLVPRSAVACTLTVGDRDIEAFWIRCRAARRTMDEHFYAHSPIVTSLTAESIGGMALASHAAVIRNEDLGRSDGQPGQTFGLQRTPVLPRLADQHEPETVEVAEGDGTFTLWTEVETFAHSNATSNHFSVDSLSGEVRFGPRIQLAGGEDRQYGRVPAKGRQVRFTRYRTGGGKEGNVGRGKLTVLKSAAKLAYVKWVNNLMPAAGGRDRETLDEYRLRGPELVRTREVAVTKGDFVKLALQASAKVARAACVAAPRAASTPASVGGNGTSRLPAPAAKGQERPAGSGLPYVQVLLVPAMVTEDAKVPREELYLTEEERRQLFRAVREYLEDRCPLTTELAIHLADYRPVSVHCRLAIRRRPDLDVAAWQELQTAIATEARRRLFRFIHPTTGGPDGEGWPFGRSLTLGDVYPLLENISGVGYVEQIELTSDLPEGPELHPPMPADRIRVAPTEVLCSGDHDVDLVEMPE